MNSWLCCIHTPVEMKCLSVVIWIHYVLMVTGKAELSFSLSQGIFVEFLCCSPSLSSHLDVCSAGYDGQTFHFIPDPLCRLWLPAGLCNSHGPLYPQKRGRLGPFSSLTSNSFIPSQTQFVFILCPVLLLKECFCHCLLALMHFQNFWSFKES